MTTGYPERFVDVSVWAATNNLSVDEARVRFAQYGVLCGIASVRPLQEGLVFKGGNALDFVWQPNRSTVDLDFSVDAAATGPPLDAESIKALLERGMSTVTPRLGTTFSVHRVRQQPRGTDRTFITYEARIGYAHQDETRLRLRMAQGEASANAIRLDISLNEPICEARLVRLDESHRLRVATIEDIVAEKLRALLQQPIRNRERRQDMLDIAVILRSSPGLDRERVARFLLEKAAARAVAVSRAAFWNPEVARRAREGYDDLEGTTRVVFVPFENALASILGFVTELPIPD
jgi:predicted nucleotidyltransferase component of viral defense system